MEFSSLCSIFKLKKVVNFYGRKILIAVLTRNGKNVASFCKIVDSEKMSMKAESKGKFFKNFCERTPFVVELFYFSLSLVSNYALCLPVNDSSIAGGASRSRTKKRQPATDVRVKM